MAMPGSSQQPGPAGPLPSQWFAVDPANKPPQQHQTMGDSSVLDERAVSDLGRTYHPYESDAYMMPNDGVEQNRLDLQHRVMFLTLDKRLHWAPIQNPRNVLDVATGTGIWALELARAHPNCRVVGSDLSLIQPANVVPNCRFIRQNAETDEWSYDTLFDYIHFRFFCCFVSSIQVVIQKAFKFLEPGGWIEFQEATHEIMSHDDTLKNSAVKTASCIWNNTMTANGRNPWAMTHLKRLLQEVGCVDVVEEIRHLPIGQWPAEPRLKEIGWMHGYNYATGIEGTVKAMVKSGLTLEAAQNLAKDVKAEIQGNGVHAHQLVYVVYGRKPLAAKG